MEIPKQDSQPPCWFFPNCKLAMLIQFCYDRNKNISVIYYILNQQKHLQFFSFTLGCTLLIRISIAGHVIMTVCFSFLFCQAVCCNDITLYLEGALFKSWLKSTILIQFFHCFPSSLHAPGQYIKTD